MPSITYTVEKETDGFWRTAEFAVEFTASRYYPATYDDPAEGGEIEVGEITLDRLVDENSDDVELTDAIKSNLVEWVTQNHLADIETECFECDVEEDFDFDWHQRDRDDRADFPERYQFA